MNADKDQVVHDPRNIEHCLRCYVKYLSWLLK